MPNKKMNVFGFAFFIAVITSGFIIVGTFLLLEKLLEKEVLPECVHNPLCNVYDEVDDEPAAAVMLALITIIVFIFLVATIMVVITVLIVGTPPTDQWVEVAVVEYVDDICNDDGEHTVIMSNGTRFEVKCHCVEEYSIGDEYSRTVRKYLGFFTETGEYAKTQ